MSFREYLDYPAVNRGRLWKLISQNPAAALIREKDSAAMQFGRALHCAVLEPELFDAEFVFYDGVRNKKHAAYQAFLKTVGKREVLTLKEYDKVQLMAAKVRSLKGTQRLFKEGNAEQTIIWNDEETGLHMKARLDWIDWGNFAVDLKSIAKLGKGDSKMAYAIHDHGYDFQASMYMDGLRAIGEPVSAYILLFASKDENEQYDCELLSLGPQTLAKGHALYLAAKREYKACMDSGEWPGRDGAIRTDFELPDWALRTESTDDIN